MHAYQVGIPDILVLQAECYRGSCNPSLSQAKAGVDDGVEIVAITTCNAVGGIARRGDAECIAWSGKWSPRSRWRDVISPQVLSEVAIMVLNAQE